MNEAKPDGTVCELLFNDMVGYFDADALRYFLDHDGNWYRIDPPSRVLHSPFRINWRPASRSRRFRRTRRSRSALVGRQGTTRRSSSTNTVASA